jgi:hypothetical protein
MPLSLPNLDDRRWADLVEEARALIPAHAPQWTNHNPSDPGITLIEAFAYLSEMLIYRLNRVSEDNVRAFVGLLNGPSPNPDPDHSTGAALKDEVRSAVLALRMQERAVTIGDYVALACAVGGVARACALPRLDVSPMPALPPQPTPAHVGVLIVPEVGVQGSALDALCAKVESSLQPLALLTTHVHVRALALVPIQVRLALTLRPDAVVATVQKHIGDALKTFFDPLVGGREGRGWPFGRAVYVSEIYQLLDGVAGLYAPSAFPNANELSTAPPDLTRELSDQGQFIGIRIDPHELPLLAGVSFA